MANKWYVIHTKPRKETTVFKYLQSRDFDVYFPRYIFVKADIAEIGISALKWIPNTVGVVKFGIDAATVSDEVINNLKQCVIAVSVKVQTF